MDVFGKKATVNREFKMHKNLLWDVITRQAGTIEKSILEAVMNSIDAGATRIDVSLNLKGFSIEDDGKGFSDQKEIEDFFETFGHPHQSGDATYGRYRMGRGQLFCFGANTWTSNLFRMDVDMKPQEREFKSKSESGLGYSLSYLEKPVKGCKIGVVLYDPLTNTSLSRISSELKNYVRFSQVPVYLNGSMISEDAVSQKWTSEDDDAYYKLNDSSYLSVYNLGVLVRQISSYNMNGIGGIVVSKKPLDVNFARNDIISSCKTWKKIQVKIKEFSGVERKKKVKFNNSELEAMASEILHEEMSEEEFKMCPIITDVKGKGYTFEEFMSALWKYSSRLSSLPSGESVGDKAMQVKNCFVLSNETLQRFKCEKVENFIEVLSDMCNLSGRMESSYRRNIKNITIVSPSDLRSSYSSVQSIIPEKSLKKIEFLGFKTLESVNYTIASSMGKHFRKLLPGESEVYSGWTDGSSYIAVNQNELSKIRGTYADWSSLIALIVHEYCHDENDLGSHVHGEEFYKTFHDAVNRGVIGMGMKEMQAYLVRSHNQKQFKLTMDLLRKIDEQNELSDINLLERPEDVDMNFK